MVYLRSLKPVFMILLGAGWFWFSAVPACRGANPASVPNQPGCVFIRERIKDRLSFLKAFRGEKAGLKSQGFIHYSLHEDIKDPRELILVLGCSDLSKGLAYLDSPAWREVLGQEGVTEIQRWSGTEVTARNFTYLPPKPAGLVVAWGSLKSFDKWKQFFDSEHDPAHGGQNLKAGKGYHPVRKYAASHYSITRGCGSPESAVVCHQASDITQAPEFMKSIPMENLKEPMGILKMEIWYGYNLQGGGL
jgi:hypothetical protein